MFLCISHPSEAFHPIQTQPQRMASSQIVEENNSPKSLVGFLQTCFLKWISPNKQSQPSYFSSFVPYVFLIRQHHLLPTPWQLPLWWVVETAAAAQLLSPLCLSCCLTAAAAYVWMPVPLGGIPTPLRTASTDWPKYISGASFFLIKWFMDLKPDLRGDLWRNNARVHF